MHGRNRGLQLERAHRPRRQRALDQADPLADARLVPECPVLLGEGHQRAVAAGAGGTTSVGEQHQRQQPGHLTGLGQALVQLTRQANRLVCQPYVVQACPGGIAVAFGEDQVQHVRDCGYPVRKLLGLGDAEACPDLPESGLRPADALSHRGLGHQERAGDLSGAQPGHSSQRQGDL
jgi:hypothetical protein